jgi:hypothetical protein
MSSTSASDRRKSVIAAVKVGTTKYTAGEDGTRRLIGEALYAMMDVELPACSAMEMWQYLHREYGTMPLEAQEDLKEAYSQMFAKVCMQVGEDTTLYVEDVIQMANNINQSGILDIDDKKIVSRIILGLPRSSENQLDYTGMQRELRASEFVGNINKVKDRLATDRVLRVRSGLPFKSRVRQTFHESGTMQCEVEESQNQSSKESGVIALLMKKVDELALAIKAPNKVESNSSQSRANSNKYEQECFNCGKKGHAVRDCRKPKDEEKIEQAKAEFSRAKQLRFEQRKQSEKARSEKVNVATTEQSEEEEAPIVQSAYMCMMRSASSVMSDKQNTEIIVDSACTVNCTPNELHFPDPTMYKRFRDVDMVTIETGDGTKLRCVGKGTMMVETESHGKIGFTETLHCPELTMSLVSVHHLSKKNIVVSFEQGKCLATHATSKKTIFEAYCRKDGLYALQAKFVKKQ